MFTIANSFMNLIGGGVSDQLGNTHNTHIGWTLYRFFDNVLPWIGNGLFFVIHVIIRFVLNIVDFMQYFVKHLGKL